jgi:hypothetical protein
MLLHQQHCKQHCTVRQHKLLRSRTAQVLQVGHNLSSQFQRRDSWLRDNLQSAWLHILQRRTDESLGSVESTGA